MTRRPFATCDERIVGYCATLGVSGAPVASFHYGQSWSRPFDEFLQTVQPFVDVTADQRTDLAQFPRLVAMNCNINMIVGELRAKRPSRTLRNFRDGPRDPYAVQ